MIASGLWASVSWDAKNLGFQVFIDGFPCGHVYNDFIHADGFAGEGKGLELFLVTLLAALPQGCALCKAKN